MDEQPFHLHPEAFARLAELALARIPEALRAHLDNCPIFIQDRPDPELLAEMGMGPEETLFGLYEGVPLTERSLIDPPLYPERILLFQEPLEAVCRNREELLAEIEITLVHEIAHFFGFTDAQLEELGYG
ncbi:MAG: metallopeptidase family protein [Desulfobulbus sp.]|jgi:predicted Zn-dependent protease with MMP-like domain